MTDMLSTPASLLMHRPPNWVGGMAAYDWDEDLARRYTLVDAFEEPYRLWFRSGNEILLPRALCPPAARDRTVIGGSQEFHSNIQPKDDDQQRVMVEAATRAMNGESFVIQAPTGAGKTYIGADLMACLDRTTCVVVHKEDILDAWVEALRSERGLGLRRDQVGLWHGNRVPPADCPVAIAMIQSVHRDGIYPSEIYRRYGLVLIDEVHKIGGDKFRGVARQFPARVRVGLSAEPRRRDGKDALIVGNVGPVSVVGEAFPMVPKVLAVPTEWVPPMSRNADGSYKTWEWNPTKTTWVNKRLASDPGRNGLILRVLRMLLSRKRNVVAFFATREHIDQMRAMLVDSGVPSSDISVYVGGIGKAERERAIRKPLALATYGMANEGTNVPWWDACVLCTPRADVTQPVGRVVREYPDKPTPLVVDLVDVNSAVLSRMAGKRSEYYRRIKAEIALIRSVKEVSL